MQVYTCIMPVLQIDSTTYNIVNQAQFNHVGTTKEYLHHLCFNKTLIDSFRFRNEIAVHHVSCTNTNDDESDIDKLSKKKIKINRFEDCVVMSSTLEDPDRYESTLVIRLLCTRIQEHYKANVCCQKFIEVPI